MFILIAFQGPLNNPTQDPFETDQSNKSINSTAKKVMEDTKPLPYIDYSPTTKDLIKGTR